MIQVLSGQVKYKDRNDYLVEYTSLGDKQYYITNKLNNGNFVTTTSLKEGIHEEMNPTSFGVINSEGETVIPCENRSINPSGEDYLLVESVNPENETVKEMASLQNDPLNANKIVSLRAELKESLTNAMDGDNGKLEFANPCSEATVCDIDGQNVVNNEKYSYIGRGDSGFYLRKVDSPTVVKYEFSTKSLSNIGGETEQPVNPMDVPLTPQVPIVEEVAEQSVEATEEVVPEAVEQEVSEAPVEAVAEQPVEDTEEVAPEAVEQEVSETPVEATQSLDTTEEVESEGTEEPQSLDTAEEVESETEETVDDTSEEIDNEEATEEVEETPDEEITDEEEDTEEVTAEAVEEEVSETPVEEVEENTDLNIANTHVDKEEIENELNNEESSEEYKVDLDDYEEDFKRDREKFSHYESNLDAEEVMSALAESEEKTDEVLPYIYRNTKKLKDRVRTLESDLEDAESVNKALKGKVYEFKENLSDLSEENERLHKDNNRKEQKIIEQQEIIERQRDENRELKNKFQQSTERNNKWREEFKKMFDYDSYDYDSSYHSGGSYKKTYDDIYDKVA